MIKAILFDVDGVLLDALKANTVLYQRILPKLGYKKPTLAEVKKVYMLPTGDALAALAKEKSKDNISVLMKFYMENSHQLYPTYLVKAPKNTKIILKRLSKHYKLGIVTGRFKVDTESEIERVTHSYKLFNIVVSREDYKNRKPAPDSLLFAVNKLKLKPNECVYIGDQEVDLIAANNAKMHFILYAKGKINGVGSLASSFSEIPKLVDKLDN